MVKLNKNRNDLDQRLDLHRIHHSMQGSHRCTISWYNISKVAIVEAVKFSQSRAMVDSQYDCKLHNYWHLRKHQCTSPNNRQG